MRTNITTIIKLLLFVTIISLLSSCSEKAEAERGRVYVIDGEWQNNYPLEGVYVESTNLIDVQIWLKLIPETIKQMVSVATAEEGDQWVSKLPEDEQYAVSMTRARVSRLQDYFNSNYSKDQNNHLQLTTLYSKGDPKVYVDKTLFGKESGQDLSSFFRLVSSTACFKVVGPEYVIADTSQPQRFPISEYFSEGTVLPHGFTLQSTEFPEELTVDDDVNLRFVFPVRAEHYWSWLLELYNNPDAEETFSDMTITLTANLKDMKSVNSIAL